ncbi:MAG: DUF4276 family protein [Thermodesulfobacteriota bacterium]
MHLEVLVEEPSVEEALKILIPKITGAEVSFSIHAHQGKPDLLAKLGSKLNAYKKWLPADHKILVLVDLDREDCRELKGRLEEAAARAGFVTKTASGGRSVFQVLNRIAIEELEAWFFGDVSAINQAYPRARPQLGLTAKYRDPDAIKGGTWEALERELQRAGHHRGRLAKITAARDIAGRMDPDSNRSRSFQVFRDGLRELVG